jgi:hypothetical protein
MVGPHDIAVDRIRAEIHHISNIAILDLSRRNPAGQWADRPHKPWYPVGMSRQEIERAVAGLSSHDLAAFAQWFEEFVADAWDRRIEEDIRNGRLDAAGQRADEDFETGRCSPL